MEVILEISFVADLHDMVVHFVLVFSLVDGPVVRKHPLHGVISCLEIFKPQVQVSIFIKTIAQNRILQFLRDCETVIRSKKLSAAS